MNFNFYIFGESFGYKQYPNDSVDFKEIYQNQQTNSLLTIKRHVDLVYYIYTQRIDKEHKSFLGFCLVFNGVYPKKIKTVFSIFEKTYSDCVLGDKLFRIGRNGKIGFGTEEFSTQKDEIDRIRCLINDELERDNKALFELLPKTYKVGQGNKTFEVSDSDEIIGNAISFYDCIFIPNNNGNEDLDYVGQTIQKLYTENNTLKANYAKLNRQKKQYRWVAFLSIAVIASLVALYFLNNNLSGVISDQDDTIQELHSVVSEKSKEIALLQDTIVDNGKTIKRNAEKINSLHTELFMYKDSLKKCEMSISELKTDLSNCQSSLRTVNAKLLAVKSVFPIKITNIEVANQEYDGTIISDFGSSIYSSQTKYLTPRISYVGINTGRSIKLKIKWYNTNSLLRNGSDTSIGCTFEQDLLVSSGTNRVTLFGWGNAKKGSWSRGAYRIEIWYDNICLKAKTIMIR